MCIYIYYLYTYVRSYVFYLIYMSLLSCSQLMAYISITHFLLLVCCYDHQWWCHAWKTPAISSYIQLMQCEVNLFDVMNISHNLK